MDKEAQEREVQADRFEVVGIAMIFRAMKLRDPNLTLEIFRIRTEPILRMASSGDVQLREIDWEEERRKVAELLER